MGNPFRRRPLPDAASILHAFAAVGRDISPDAARRLADEIAVYGDLERAALALANDDAHALLSDLLAYRAALAEFADPALRIARLRRQAADLDARAEPAWAEAAEFAGKAAHRRAQGETGLAHDFERRVVAAERFAADLEQQAFACRLQAALLQADSGRRDAFADLLTALAA
jgi:hypothetical protein